MLLFVPIQWVITTQLKKIQTELMRHKDKRIKLVDEVLSGIKVILHYFYCTFVLSGAETVCMGKLLCSKYHGNKKR